MNLHDTIMGKELVEKGNKYLPVIAKQLKRIADALEGNTKTNKNSSKGEQMTRYPKINIPDNDEEYRKPYDPDESKPVKRVCVDCGEILPVCYCNKEEEK